MTIEYSAAELGVFRTLLKLKGTMIPLVLVSPIFWVLVVVHAIFLVLKNLRDANGSLMFPNMPPIDWKGVSLASGFLTFFLVFYGSQCYSRMNMFYGHCVGLGGTTMNWVSLVKLHITDKHQQWNATRLILASMHIQYYTLNESEGGAAISEEEWNNILKRNLLTPSEMDTLTAYKGYKPFLPLVWALNEVEDALLSKVSGEGKDATAQRFTVADLLSNFRELAFGFRGHCGQITNQLKQPVPFPYFHALVLLITVVLVLVSYALVVNTSMAPEITALIYVMVCTIFLGLKEVAVAMSDPFGDDDVDFDLEKMLKGAYTNAVALLRDDRRPLGTDLDNLINPITSDAARFTVGGPLMEAGTVPNVQVEMDGKRLLEQPTGQV